MPNDALRHALSRSRLTESELADRIGVDPKTVGRWIQNDGRVPHAKHRYAVAQAVGVEADVIWPDGVRRNVKTGYDREIVSVYPRRADMPKSAWKSLFTSATTEITLAGYTSYFLWLELPNLRSVLARKAASGCQVRFLLGDPDSPVTRHRETVEAVPLTITTRINVTLDELAKMGSVRGVEAKFSDGHVAMSLWRFDDDMIMATHLHHLVGHDSPHFHIQRCQDGGVFDRYAYHLAELWKSGRPVTGLSERQSPE
jgi:transcriptional regulator with XRE-family HTH domain